MAVRRLRLLAVAVLIALSAHPADGLAHAILMSSQPANGGSVAGPAVTIDLHFNGRIDHKRSILLLTGSDGRQQPLPQKDDAAQDEISAEASLAPGTYTLRWQVLSIDGHITRGDVPFTVTAP